ncbi:DsbA family protein [Consotaella aegiceratis]|uniref:DsbA family protein n=1 Tax=Consotaella aegiceratis TaxID=3097961 RepID=UPI002F3ECE17
MNRLPRHAGKPRQNPATSPLRLAGTLLAGAALLTLAGCFDEAEDQANDQVEQMIVAQAEQPAEQTAKSAAVDAPAAQGSVDVAKLMDTQPLPDVVVGDADAPVTIVEYASLTCSHCADFHAETLPVVMKDYVDTGKAKFILREFPFDPLALSGFMLARCAPGDRRTAMTDVLFEQQDTWARAEKPSVALLQLAKLAGFTQDTFTQCLNDKDLQGKVMEVQKAGESFGVNATPTFFINGDKYAGALSPDEMSAVLDAHL